MYCVYLVRQDKVIRTGSNRVLVVYCVVLFAVSETTLEILSIKSRMSRSKIYISTSGYRLFETITIIYVKNEYTEYTEYTLYVFSMREKKTGQSAAGFNVNIIVSNPSKR